MAIRLPFPGANRSLVSRAEIHNFAMGSKGELTEMSQGRGGGPKPGPIHLKLVKGTLRKSRMARTGPQPAPGRLDDPPDFLCAPALAEWRRLAPDLTRLGYLTPLDRAVFAAYCQSYGRWAQAESALAAADLITTTPNGFGSPHPLVAIGRRAASDMLRYAAELGLTPIARLRLAEVVPPAPAPDPADQFF
jgi:P27 family predicted phage terminase small subunit